MGEIWVVGGVLTFEPSIHLVTGDKTTFTIFLYVML